MKIKVPTDSVLLKVKSESVTHSVVSDSGSQWTVAHQAPLSMEFSRRILEWVTNAFSRGSSCPRDQTRVSCIVVRFFIILATREAPVLAEGSFTKPSLSYILM